MSLGYRVCDRAVKIVSSVQRDAHSLPVEASRIWARPIIYGYNSRKAYANYHGVTQTQLASSVHMSNASGRTGFVHPT